MDKVRLYAILDIDSPDEFQYYENLAALLEADEYIEENLLNDLLCNIDRERLAEHFESFFEEFLRHLPDSETEMYILVESMKRAFDGLIFDDMNEDDIAELASEISRFRKWYVHDLKVFNRLNGDELSVRDARYDIVAAGLLGEAADFDFRLALDYRLDGFNVKVSDMISSAAVESNEGTND